MSSKNRIHHTNRVVITGIGPVTSIGCGKDIFLQNLLEKKCRIKPVPEKFEKYYHFKSTFYSPLPDITLTDHGIDTGYEKILHYKDKLAILAAKLALEDAGFTLCKKQENKISVTGLKECSIILGTGISAVSTACDSYVSHLANGNTGDLHSAEKTFRFHRMVVPMTMANSSAAWISILFHLTGPAYTVNASCASANYAIGESFRKIKFGRDKVILTGGVEYLKDDYGYAMRGFDLLGTLTRSGDGLPRPFSKNRSGFLFSEGGACVLVLEEYHHALQRNADIYAEIIDFQSNSDAHSIVLIEPDGKQIRKLVKKVIKNHKIDYINTHGTATETNDLIEAQLIREFFGNKETQPLINSTKGILGHTIGASAALEAAVTAMAIRYSRIHGNLTSDPIDNLNLNDQSMEKTVKYALSFSFGFGGHNSCLLLKGIS
jgi:3-oxoacyl-[acyl-carrier-protein] synthase II